jgi:hypothetical protein
MAAILWYLHYRIIPSASQGEALTCQVVRMGVFALNPFIATLMEPKQPILGSLSRGPGTFGVPASASDSGRTVA